MPPSVENLKNDYTKHPNFQRYITSIFVYLSNTNQQMRKVNLLSLWGLVISFVLIINSLCFPKIYAQSAKVTVSNSKQALTTDKEYIQALKQLLTVTGSMEGVDQVGQEAVGYYHSKYPMLSDSFLVQIDQSLSIDSLITRFMPLYSRHFSLSEIKGLITIYNTALGKKIVHEMPLLMQEKATVTENLYNYIQQRVEKELAKQSKTGQGEQENNQDK